MWCGMVWHDVAWCGMVRKGVVCCSVGYYFVEWGDLVLACASVQGSQHGHGDAFA